MTWTPSEIREARRQPLVQVLKKTGHLLERRENGNFLVLNMPGKVVIKENYWVNHDDNTAGNAIDFFVKLCGKSFSETMGILTG